MDFIALTFIRACIHTINKREPSLPCATVDPSSCLTVLDPAVSALFKVRLNDAFGKRGKSFEDLPIANIGEYSFFGIAKNLRTLEDIEFLDATVLLANKLAESQTRQGIPGGYMITIDAVDNLAQPVVIAIKAELHEALRNNSEGEIPMLELVNDIFLSKSDKLFKIGILMKKDNPEESYPNSEWTAILYDENFTPGSKPSDYFWNGFLGLDISKNGKIQTSRFYTKMVDFIAQNYQGFEAQNAAKTRLEELMANENITILDPEQIKQTIIAPDLRGDFTEEIQSEFSHLIPKDTTLLENKIENHQIYFNNGIKVTGKKNQIQQQMRIIKNSDQLRNLSIEPGATIIVLPGDPSTVKK
ncbi:hypothetical protein [Adhaeribacter terreus]|uniref:Nucleoid-associated protein n=1 Tax=Adhaeribacter terreus TaxID=529703 RepID=A0ABW0EAI1_9BACT